MGYFISRRKLKKKHGINSLKNNLNQTIHSYELVANMAYQNNDYKTIQRLNNYNVELQRSADFLFMGKVFAAVVATSAVSTIVSTSIHNVMEKR
jgi:hypothetical protein